LATAAASSPGLDYQGEGFRFVGASLDQARDAGEHRSGVWARCAKEIGELVQVYQRFSPFAEFLTEPPQAPQGSAGI
jgi:hypothetical protein